jgi:hypothetical protein
VFGLAHVSCASTIRRWWTTHQTATKSQMAIIVIKPRQMDFDLLHVCQMLQIRSVRAATRCNQQLHVSRHELGMVCLRGHVSSMHGLEPCASPKTPIWDYSMLLASWLKKKYRKDTPSFAWPGPVRKAACQLCGPRVISRGLAQFERRCVRFVGQGLFYYTTAQIVTQDLFIFCELLRPRIMNLG